jgi:hypothetical protein
MMLLPEDEVGKLGLSRGGLVIVTDADDRREELPTARGLDASLLGRSMVTDCVVAPPLCEALIGQLVLEELDLVVDCARNNPWTAAGVPDSAFVEAEVGRVLLRLSQTVSGGTSNASIRLRSRCSRQLFSNSGDPDDARGIT